MTSNDMTAIGVLHALYKAEARVPEDFSVIGFDDVTIAQFTLPPLTSVQMSRHELARCAVLALRDHLETQPSSYVPRYKVQTKLTVRQSTGLPAARPFRRGNSRSSRKSVAQS
jgi:DNA-binding LacI/PurR family transcriptional regulator